MELTAARPVIAPGIVIVSDGGRVLVPETVIRACAS
jgi:hypothetical protein